MKSLLPSLTIMIGITFSGLAGRAAEKVASFPASVAALRAAGIAPEVLNRQLCRAVDVPTEGPTGWHWSRVMATPERLVRATQTRDWAAA